MAEEAEAPKELGRNSSSRIAAIGEITKAIAAITALIATATGLWIAIFGASVSNQTETAPTDGNASAKSGASPARPAQGPLPDRPSDGNRRGGEAGPSGPPAVEVTYPDGRVMRVPINAVRRIDREGTFEFTDDCVAPNYRDANGVCVAPAPPCPNGSPRDPYGQCAIIDPIVTCPPPPQSDGMTQVRQTQLSSCPRPAVALIGPFIVYFDWDQDTLGQNARSTLDQAAQAYAAAGRPQIVLSGHADRSGSATYNLGLSQRRAHAVRDYLVMLGVPESSMTTEAFGETRPSVDTADGVREPDNRRVELMFGPADQGLGVCPDCSAPLEPQPDSGG